MSTHHIGFYEDLTKNIFQFSSNMHLFSLTLVHVNVLLNHFVVIITELF